MTDRLAIFIAMVAGALLMLDFAFNSGQASLFLAKKMMDLIEWLAFWR